MYWFSHTLEGEWGRVARVEGKGRKIDLGMIGKRGFELMLHQRSTNSIGSRGFRKLDGRNQNKGARDAGKKERMK